MTSQNQSPLEKISSVISARDARTEARLLRNAEFEAESNKMRLERKEFLESIGAVPAPPSFYALWLYTFLQQPDAKLHRVLDTPYPVPKVDEGETKSVKTLSGFNQNGVILAQTEVGYYDSSHVIWLATKDSDAQIPEGYGALSMNILHVEGLTHLNTRRHTKKVGREFGHSAVFTLKLTDDGNHFIATTNQLDTVPTYPEVNDIIAGLSEEDSIEDVASHIKKGIERRKIAETAAEDQRKAEEANKAIAKKALES